MFPTLQFMQTRFYLVLLPAIKDSTKKGQIHIKWVYKLFEFSPILMFFNVQVQNIPKNLLWNSTLCPDKINKDLKLWKEHVTQSETIENF